MSRLIFGDLLEVSDGVILHQVNVYGVMGGGIAYYLSKCYPSLLGAYKGYISKTGSENLMGSVFYHNVGKVIIGNCFSQNIDNDNDGNLTSYVDVEKCFDNVKKHFPNESVYLPFQYGCGIAGGNWNIVSKILEKYDFTIVARQADYTKWENAK